MEPVKESEALWDRLEKTAATFGLPERVVSGLFSASLGLRLRRSAYQVETGVEPGTANRDLKAMVSAGLLEARGETRGRYYLGTDLLRQPYAEIRAESRRRVFDPYDALPEIPSGPIAETLERTLF